MDQENPRVVADVHESRSGIPGLLEQLGARVELAALPAGDYAVSRGTLVERKQVRELHVAVTEGRFWSQLGKLRSGTKFPYLLIEGADLDDGPLTPKAIRGVVLTVAGMGVAVLRSRDQSDSALWLHRLAILRQRREAPADRPVYAQRRKPAPRRQASEAVLAAVPGISTETARALLAHFGTAAAVLSAEPEELLAVRGVGPDRIRSLRQTLNHPHHRAQPPAAL